MDKNSMRNIPFIGAYIGGFEDVFKAVEKTVSGDVGGGISDGLDAISPASFVSRMAESFGVDDAETLEKIELGVNIGTLSPIGIFKSLADLEQIEAKNKADRIEIAAAFATESPHSALERARGLPTNRRNAGIRQQVKAAASAQARAGAKAKVAERADAYGELRSASSAVRERGLPGVANGGYASGDGAATPGSVLAGMENLQREALDGFLSSGSGPFMAELPMPATFEDILSAFMMDIVKEEQDKVTNKFKQMEIDNEKAAQMRTAINFLETGASVASLVAGAAGTPIAGAVVGMGTDAAIGFLKSELETQADSRALQFEKLKDSINKIQQMQSALSNVLKAMHDTAMTSINNIK